ncbi:penicillin-binding protein activator [Oceanibacterium hippocampi]|uniref:Leucine-binding protein domain-containing protein n=1 Tax=Oceanibacterium hippocampi TaxID=745714 RepID=A0A1Y5RI05_9PROT|nr:penicillin-binding protein activator [Oceanibacterium hippocampi]SLN17921.1 hypothetical protein OCH7691_00364 [Oceanibacterium hippocampi]
MRKEVNHPSTRRPAGPRLRALGAAAALLFALAACSSSPPPEPAPPPPAAETQPSAPVLPPQPTITQPAGPSAPIVSETRLIPPRPGAPTPIKIGLLLPLSGPNAEIGQALLNAAQIALFDARDPRLMLLPGDTGATPEGAVAAANQVLSEGAQLLLGPLFATAAPAVGEVARARGVNVVTFSNDRRVAGNGVFVLGLTPEQQIMRVIAGARRDGLSRFALLAPDSPYGRSVADALRVALLRYGGSLVREEIYPATLDPGGDEMHATIRRLADYEARRRALQEQRRALTARQDAVAKRALRRLETLDTFGDLDYDAVVLPEGGGRLRAIAPLLPFYDIDTSKQRLIGTGLWAEPGLGKEPAMVGGWFAAPEPGNAEVFSDRYKAAYGTVPPRIASLAYDALALAAALANEADGADFSVTALESPGGFLGYDGIFRFGPDGVAERGLAILEITAEGTRVRSPAPIRFEDIGS